MNQLESLALFGFGTKSGLPAPYKYRTVNAAYADNFFRTYRIVVPPFSRELAWTLEASTLKKLALVATNLGDTIGLATTS